MISKRMLGTSVVAASAAVVWGVWTLVTAAAADVDGPAVQRIGVVNRCGNTVLDAAGAEESVTLPLRPPPAQARDADAAVEDLPPLPFVEVPVVVAPPRADVYMSGTDC